MLRIIEFNEVFLNYTEIVFFDLPTAPLFSSNAANVITRYMRMLFHRKTLVFAPITAN